MNQPLTDPELPTEDFVKGHLNAFEKLYGAYHPLMQHFARELVRDAAIADSIVTDSFIKLWIQHAELSTTQNIAAFLHISIERSCLAFLRQVEKLSDAQRQIISDHIANQGKPHIPGNEYIRSLIVGWLNRLPPPADAITRMAYEEGVDDAQIAAQLQLTPDDVGEQKRKCILLVKGQWLSKTEKELLVFRDWLQKAKG